jgi:hypothetical protein
MKFLYMQFSRISYLLIPHPSVRNTFHTHIPYLMAGNQISHTYESTGKIIDLYILTGRQNVLNGIVAGISKIQSALNLHKN